LEEGEQNESRYSDRYFARNEGEKIDESVEREEERRKMIPNEEVELVAGDRENRMRDF
jgi:hypothetical protein